MSTKDMNEKILLGKRVFAYVVDTYLGGVVTSIPVILTWNMVERTEELATDLTKFQAPYSYVAGILGLLFACGYFFIWPLLHNGQTLGMRLMGLMLVNEEGTTLSCKQMALRQIVGLMILEGSFMYCGTLVATMVGMLTVPMIASIVSYIMLAALVISIVMIFKSGRGIHDLLGKSYVVECNKG